MSHAVVDNQKCQGHGQCAMMAPDVFELDADGFAVVRIGEVPEALLGQVETAVFSCPEQAIELED